MATTQDQNDRAYAMAEQWANNPDRLYEMLSCRITRPEEFKQICGHLATAFSALTDFQVSNERTVREASTAISMIRGVIVERLLLPTAEQILFNEKHSAVWTERRAA
jgi:hypothetical protein